MNYQNGFDADEQKCLLLYNKFFPFKEFQKYILIIFSNCYIDPDMDNLEKIEELRKNSYKILFITINKTNNSDIIDCKKIKPKNFNSFYQVKK